MDSGIGIAGHSTNFRMMTSSKLDMFQPITYENGVTKSYDVEYYPITPPGDNGPIEFYIPPDPEKVIDIQTMKLYGSLRTKKKKTDGSWIYTALTDKVYFINNYYQSLWSNVIIKMNDTEFGDNATNNYAYGAYLQTLLGARECCKDTILWERGFIKDKFGDDFDSVDDTKNTALKSRRCSGNLKRMVIPLHNDLMTAQSYIPPNTKFTITFKRTEDKFVLMQGDASEYKVDLSNIFLKVRKYDVSEEVKKYYSKMLKTKPLVIPYTKNIFKMYTKTQGDFDLSNYNLFQASRLPDRVYVLMVEQDAFQGNFKKSPFHFQNFNMKEASLVVNDVCEPSTPYKYGVNQPIKDIYFDFLENTGTSPFEMDCVWITKKEYQNSYFILAFDRSPTKNNGLYTHKMEGGTMGIKMSTSKALESNIMVMVYASYSDTLQFVDDKVKTEII